MFVPTKRIQFCESLLQATLRAAPCGRQVAVLVLGLDRPDDAGSMQLEQVERLLADTLDQGTLIARLAGAEYAILIEGFVDPDALAVLSRRLLAACAVHAPASIGISLFPGHGTLPGNLLSLASAARAKRAGGYYFFAPVPQHAAKRTLLLLDDEPNILSALRRLFRPDGYHVLTANSANEAFALLSANEVQVVLSDQRMPEMHGIEFLACVHEHYPDTVRMILSGYSDLVSVTQALERGVIHTFLTKPWNDEALRSDVRDAFRTHATAQGRSAETTAPRRLRA